MSRDPNKAIATLVRWREFQEARASDEFRQRSAKTRQAKATVDLANANVEKVQKHRALLLESPNLDLPRLLMAAQIEEVHWHQLREHQAVHVAAQELEGQALAQHVAARAHTRVAEARKQRKNAEHSDHAEKMSFDWMADLHNQHRKDQR